MMYNILHIIILLLGILIVVLLLYNIHRSIILYSKIYKEESTKSTDFTNVCKDYIPCRNAGLPDCTTCIVLDCERIIKKY